MGVLSIHDTEDNCIPGLGSKALSLSVNVCLSAMILMEWSHITNLKESHPLKKTGFCKRENNHKIGFPNILLKQICSTMLGSLSQMPFFQEGDFCQTRHANESQAHSSHSKGSHRLPNLMFFYTLCKGGRGGQTDV